MLSISKYTISIYALVVAHSAFAATKPYLYEMNGEKFEGILATPDASYTQLKADKIPGILLVHNWMGVTNDTAEQAQKLANLGFVVLAADIYGQGKRPNSAQEAGKFAGKYKGDRKLFRERLNLAYQQLKKHENLNQKLLFAAGYCFGGTGVLELARSGAELSGVMSFHGGLDSPNIAEGKNIKARVIAFHGADDPYVSGKDLAAFEDEMRSAKVDWQLIKLGNAVHSFTDKSAGNDNSKGAAYNEAADKRSWAQMRLFLQESGAKVIP